MMSPMEVNTYLGMLNLVLRQVDTDEDPEAKQINNKMREALATAQLYLMEMSMESIVKELGNE